MGLLVGLFPSASPILLLSYLCITVISLLVIFIPRLMYARAQVRKHRALCLLPDQQLTALQALFKNNLTQHYYNRAMAQETGWTQALHKDNVGYLVGLASVGSLSVWWKLNSV